MTLLLVLSLATGASAAAANTDNKLKTVASYLNFYLLNINACEDFHPTVRKRALVAENIIYGHLEKLSDKVKEFNLKEDEKAAIANTVVDRRARLNEQIAENEFTLEHCEAIIDIVRSGLDSSLLKILK